ncbi:MAG TPA: hypothetical protein VLB76_03980 [Thermoanaerobaculia bacterium]|nr:hypothetical protein [Thermoanaerobaculia bacterium]
MKRIHRVLWSALFLLALVSLAGCRSCHRQGVEAPPVTPGVDAFQTASGPGKTTSVDFAANPIPANFFCAGSPAFNGRIDLVGSPLVTNPAGVVNDSDTLVERLQEASFGGGPVTVPVKVKALRLASASDLSISCTSGTTKWRLAVCECGNQPSTDIVVKVEPECGCGHFDGNLEIKTCLRFTNVDDNTVKGPITQDVKLTINNMPWCPKPIQGALQISGPFSVKDCDGNNVQVRATSNFFPGYSCAEQGPGVDCWTKHADLTHCHEGPSPDHQHCVNPVCGKRQG